ncbi:hypothetical protein FJT64_016661 [Amphibalanus amphitrite]|uniref:Uncharacterized protein n=1 Tax=Amphibalanus amphitrite TaxID=1232801 RepID=A0A6A4XDM5_AMPAM|nr:hypothetical protein FJT64_016661 [Amphibalanus amphitrite]
MSDVAHQLGKEVTYVIKFNDLDVYTRGKEQATDGSAAEASGPVAEKTCPPLRPPRDELRHGAAALGRRGPNHLLHVPQMRVSMAWVLC